MKIETLYNINQKVYITELKICGLILSININSYIKYYIRYFDGCDAKECYFLENELKEQEPNKEVGFKDKI